MNTLMKYYYCINGADVVGPYSFEELEALVTKGVLTGSAQLRAEGQGKHGSPYRTLFLRSRRNPLPFIP
jgi:hypothetical protein